jgi:hypothetical protein
VKAEGLTYTVMTHCNVQTACQRVSLILIKLAVQKRQQFVGLLLVSDVTSLARPTKSGQTPQLQTAPRFSQSARRS